MNTHQVQFLLSGGNLCDHLRVFRKELEEDQRSSFRVDAALKKVRITAEAELMQIGDACDLTPGQADAITALEQCIDVLRENEMFSGGRGRLR